jgi:hypothetical protein
VSGSPGERIANIAARPGRRQANEAAARMAPPPQAALRAAKRRAFGKDATLCERTTCHCVEYDSTMSPRNLGVESCRPTPATAKGQAEECARRARMASSPEVTAQYRDLGLQWVTLAQRERAGLQSWFRRETNGGSAASLVRLMSARSSGSD